MTMIDKILDVMQARGLQAYEPDVKAVIEAMRDPTEAMWLSRPVGCPEREMWARWWGWQIDAMLNEDAIFQAEPTE